MSVPHSVLSAEDLHPETKPVFETYVAPQVERGSALDVSFLLDAPAGRHGHTVAAGEQLVFNDGTPARFWGVNLAWEAQYPRPEQIPEVVRRLRSHGINMVRLTYLDWRPPRGPLDRLTADDVEVNTDQLAKLDRLAAALIEGGIYLDVALMMGGPVSGVAPGGDLHGKDVSALQMIHPAVIAAHRGLVELLLNHTNPHTGRTWGEEPGIAILELYNEGDPFYLRRSLRNLPAELQAPLHKTWRAWLKAGSMEGPDTLDLARLDAKGPEADAAIHFLSDLQAAHAARMRAFVRQHGYRGVICDSAGGAYSPAARWAQRDAGIQVAHYYHDHLSFGRKGTSWRNVSACRSGCRSLLAAAWERDPRRPYLLGEWDFCWPNQYRAEGVPLTAAFAAMQGWTGTLQFTYWSQSWDNVDTTLGKGARISSVWRIMSDPAVMALYPAAAMMFLRGDVSPCRELIDPAVNAFTVRNWPALDARAFLHRYGTRLEPDFTETPTRASAQPRLLVSDTGEITYDRDAGVLVIDTPRSQAVIGMAGGRRSATSDIAVEVENPFAVLTVSSLTAEPIGTSRRLLLTTVAQVQNTDFQARHSEGTTFLKSHGRAPIRAEVVKGHMTLKGTGAVVVHALNPDGSHRRDTVTTVSLHDGVRIELASSVPALHYEIIRRPNTEAMNMGPVHPNRFRNAVEITAMETRVRDHDLELKLPRQTASPALSASGISTALTMEDVRPTLRRSPSRGAAKPFLR